MKITKNNNVSTNQILWKCHWNYYCVTARESWSLLLKTMTMNDNEIHLFKPNFMLHNYNGN